MSNVVVSTGLTLDGVMQAPGRPDEDHRGGFKHGGLAQLYNDSVMGKVAGEGYAYWPKQTNNPFTEALNNTLKYVASTTLAEPLAWRNSTLLKGDAAEAVARLKQQPGNYRLGDSVATTTGVLVATYRPTEPAAGTST